MSEPSPAKPNRVRRILIVDDDDSFRMMFKDFLDAYRPGAWEVTAAADYTVALASLKERSVDLIVLDIQMPVMDGLQLLRLLKRTYPELPVVMLTSSASAANREQALQNGAALFFDKTEVAGGLDKLYAALESITTAPTQGFRGVLRQVGLTEVLQMECLGRKSSILEVTAPGLSGRIFIEDGSIIHADSGSIQGEPALFHLLGLHGGEFQLKPFAKPERKTIDGQWESLVMEAARLFDEATATADAAEAAAEASEPGIPEAPAPPPSAPVIERQVEEIVLCSERGQILYEWQSRAPEKRVQLIEQFSKMSDMLGGALSLGRADRLEVETKNGRVILLLQADRKLFCETRRPPGAKAK